MLQKTRIWIRLCQPKKIIVIYFLIIFHLWQYIHTEEYSLPNEPGVWYRQTVEEVHEHHHDQEDEGDEEDVADRVRTI